MLYEVITKDFVKSGKVDTADLFNYVLDTALDVMYQLTMQKPLENAISSMLSSRNNFVQHTLYEVIRGIGKAIVRISKREDVEGIWQDIQDRILRNLSRITSYNVCYTKLLRNVIIKEEKTKLEKAITVSIKKAGTYLRNELRRQVRSARLGKGLEKAWQVNVYPNRGRSMSASALVFSKSVRLHNVFEDGA